jgi:tubulin polyglutamylase TTLL1/tubulin monoglycylase TTLL3/8
MEKPLLYKGRKFDMRHYLLLTCVNGIMKAYWFPEGYIRTSSCVFNLKKGNNVYIHLTNDAVQKHS